MLKKDKDRGSLGPTVSITRWHANKGTRELLSIGANVFRGPR